MDWATVLDGIDAALASDQGRAEKAARIAALIREACVYRWVGVYEVTDHEIARTIPVPPPDGIAGVLLGRAIRRSLPVAARSARSARLGRSG